MEQSNNANIRVGRRRIAEYVRALNDRDKAILQSIRTCRFIQTCQIGRLHFGTAPTTSAGLRAATRTLTKLHSLGLIQPLRRRIGGVRAGSSSYVWVLKAAGAILLDTLDHKPTRPVRPYEPTYIFLAHTLAVTEVYVRLHTHPSVKLRQAELEPVCWRSYAAYGGSACLKPDFYAVTAIGGYEDHWFFEADMDTESPSRIIRKCEYYISYYQSGKEQKSTGIFPRVVWIAPNEKRRKTLCRHICESLRDYKDLFAVITFMEFDMLIGTGSASIGIGQAGD